PRSRGRHGSGVSSPAGARKPPASPGPAIPIPEAAMKTPIRSIVVGVAEVQEEDPHLAPAVRLAEALGATLHVVHAFTLPDPALYPFATASVFDPEVVRRIQDAARTLLEEQVRRISDSDRIVCRAVSVPAD